MKHVATVSTSTDGPPTSGAFACGISCVSLRVNSQANSAFRSAFATAAISSASRTRKRLCAGVNALPAVAPSAAAMRVA